MIIDAVQIVTPDELAKVKQQGNKPAAVAKKPAGPNPPRRRQ